VRPGLFLLGKATLRLMTVREVFELAVAHQQAGRLAEAETIYRQLLTRYPENPELINNLAALQLQSGRYAEAVSQAKRASQLKPRFAEASFVAGVALLQLKNVAGAIESLEQAIEFRPDYAEAMSALGTALDADGQIDAAIEQTRRAIALRPGFSQAHNNLGNLLREKGRDAEAFDAYQRALALNPNDVEVLNNLGGMLLEGQPNAAGAVTYLRRAVTLKPDFVAAHYNLGNALQRSGDVDAAIASYQRALSLDSTLVEAWINLANAQHESGRLDDAIESFRRGKEVGLPPRLASTPLYAMHYDPRNSPADLLAAHTEWNQRYAAGLARNPPHQNDRAPDRRLRIGYVSADLSNHPVSRFMLPLLTNHDPNQVEVFVYSSTRKDDDFTPRLRASVHTWRDVRHLNDERLAALVEQDQIDILIDLTMHATNARLLMFARKPAPVQLTYLAYPGTTGLPQMDYRLSDPYIDPPGQTEAHYSERTLRLPHTYWCYAPPPEASSVVPPPVLSRGFITFGSSNASAKASRPIFDAWIEILARVPNSRLLMHSREGNHRDELRNRLSSRGVDPSRIEFFGFRPADQYFANYGNFDIALDTHPYAGGTTTCDALWMGVPVVTLAGATAISRGASSILSNVGLLDLVMYRVEAYIAKACELAADVNRLQTLRATMRDRMLASPLMNAPQFARDIEAAYRTAWHRWVEQP
jgi:protein O-GlcNAc transferase